jgi:hypothetical protein
LTKKHGQTPEAIVPPHDLDAGMGLGEVMRGRKHRRENTIVFPGDTSERFSYPDRNKPMHLRAHRQ